MNPSRLALTVFRAAALGALLAAGCRPAVPPAEDEGIPVRVQPAVERTLNRMLDYAGSIRAREQALIYPRVSGKIVARLKSEGHPVARGEALALVDRDEVGYDYEKSPVESSLSGLVGRVYADLGASVTPQTPVAQVVDIDAVEVEFPVPEKYVAQVAGGQLAELTVDAWPGQAFTGKVTQISPVLDLDTRTAPVEITVPNPGRRLKPGMFARVRLILETRPAAPTVLKEAVLGKDPDTYVFVVSNGTAMSRPVQLGLRQDNAFEVLSGLAAGESVVIMGQQRLHDGVAVRTDPDDAQRAAPKRQTP